MNPSEVYAESQEKNMRSFPSPSSDGKIELGNTRSQSERVCACSVLWRGWSTISRTPFQVIAKWAGVILSVSFRHRMYISYVSTPTCTETTHHTSSWVLAYFFDSIFYFFHILYIFHFGILVRNGHVLCGVTNMKIIRIGTGDFQLLCVCVCVSKDNFTSSSPVCMPLMSFLAWLL